MSKFKFNLYCNDKLEPSSSDKNTPKYVEWDYHGNGDVNLYVSQRALDAINDRSGKPTYIWLLESRQIIPQFYDWVLNNYDFVMSRVDVFLVVMNLFVKSMKVYLMVLQTQHLG